MFPQLRRVLGWLRQGYPQGIPSGDFVPLVALLSRRLTDEELRELGVSLHDAGMLPADRIDIGQGYLRITDELATTDQVRRVADRLRTAGWDVSDPTLHLAD